MFDRWDWKKGDLIIQNDPQVPKKANKKKVATKVLRKARPARRRKLLTSVSDWIALERKYPGGVLVGPSPAALKKRLLGSRMKRLNRRSR